MYDDQGYPVKQGSTPQGNVQQGTYGTPIATGAHQPVASNYERVALGARSSWNSSICDCFMDCSVCLEVVLCVCGEQARVAAVVMDNKQDSMNCPIFLFTFFCFSFDSWVTYYLRSRVVARYNIDEGCGKTLCFGCCLPQCSSCQLHREILLRGEFPGGCFANEKPSIRPPPPTGTMGYSQM